LPHPFPSIVTDAAQKGNSFCIFLHEFLHEQKWILHRTFFSNVLNFFSFDFAASDNVFFVFPKTVAGLWTKYKTGCTMHERRKSCIFVPPRRIHLQKYV